VTHVLCRLDFGLSRANEYSYSASRARVARPRPNFKLAVKFRFKCFTYHRSLVWGYCRIW